GESSLFAKHKWSAGIAWIVIVAAILIPRATNAPKFDKDIKMTGLESLDTNKKIEKHFNQESEKAQIRVVFKTTKDDGIVQPNITKDIKKTLDDIKKDDLTMREYNELTESLKSAVKDFEKDVEVIENQHHDLKP
ncbi:coagulase domain-containing protein, partial [Staphylococcus aureus]|uniref:coagulase domain-containing protein n=1 Tax=Staphylococcus aureus TaxID=1280 RepID=UPI00272EA100